MVITVDRAATITVNRVPHQVRSIAVTAEDPDTLIAALERHDRTRTRFHDRLAQDAADVPAQDRTTPDVVARRAVDAHLRDLATLHVPEPTRRQRADERARRLRRDLRDLRSRLPTPVKAVGRRAQVVVGGAARAVRRRG